ncbi:MAG: flagellar biosynthesis protein FlhF, partial [bacterium]
MKRKTYKGDTMKQARLKVKRDLGNDAKILETRKVREGGIFGFFSETKVEVDACRSPERNGQKSERSNPSGRQSTRRRGTSKTNGRKTSGGTAGRSNGAAASNQDNGSANFERSVNEPVEPKVSPREQATQLIKEQERGGSNGESTYNRPAPDLNRDSESVSTETNGTENSRSEEDSISEEKIRQVLENTDRLSEKIDQLAESVQGTDEQKDASPGENYPGELSSLFQELLDAGVQREYARDLIGRAQRTLEADKLDQRSPVEDELKSLVEDDLTVADPLRTDRDETLLIPFVGPTGVGKTTTMAKLAAHFSVEESQSVSFITFDTYRLAAVEQLRCYADILQVPIEA